MAIRGRYEVIFFSLSKYNLNSIIIDPFHNIEDENEELQIIVDEKQEIFNIADSELQRVILSYKKDIIVPPPPELRGGNQYNKIVNPETGRKVSIHNKKGQEILNKYFNS